MDSDSHPSIDSTTSGPPQLPPSSPPSPSLETSDPSALSEMARQYPSSSSSPTTTTTVPTAMADDTPMYKGDDVVSPNDTDIDDEDLDDSDGDLGTPLGVGGPAGFGDFDDEEYSSHRFLGPSVVGDDTSARALHGLRRVMVHAKPPKFASEISSLRASFSSRRTSSAATYDTRHGSMDQPANSYQVSFSESKPTGFTTRLSLTGSNSDTAELAVRIAAVERDSPAFKAGVVVGDTLLSINDNPIEPHMTAAQVEALLVSQRGTRTIVFTRGSVEAPPELRHSQSHSKSSSSSSSEPDSVEKKPAGRFSKSKFTSALSYGSSLMASKLKRRKSVVHKGISCEGCGVDSITGALWTCSVCSDFNLCSECYDGGTHGMENTDAMKSLNEALVQFRLQKQCKHFTPEFLLSLRRDICKGRPDKFQYMGGWIADIVNGTAPSKITVRGIEIPHLPATSRQRFVGKLMPLVSNRTDIEVHIEWLPDDSVRASMDVDMDVDVDVEMINDVDAAIAEAAPEDLEKLRIWISDKKTRTASPFA